ncbi:MAG: hypothetical protein OQK66_04370, partial [Prosthecochloris sp.]|uniref:hypothetical protein n=1 Tax=Prosthecochloris sp. TaxID=290513 RepID=UPI002589E486
TFFAHTKYCGRPLRISHKNNFKANLARISIIADCMALAEQIVTSTIPYRAIRQLANHPRTDAAAMKMLPLSDLSYLSTAEYALLVRFFYGGRRRYQYRLFHKRSWN